MSSSVTGNVTPVVFLNMQTIVFEWLMGMSAKTTKQEIP